MGGRAAVGGEWWRKNNIRIKLGETRAKVLKQEFAHITEVS